MTEEQRRANDAYTRRQWRDPDTTRPPPVHDYFNTWDFLLLVISNTLTGIGIAACVVAVGYFWGLLK